jgi:hypothetical protein
MGDLELYLADAPDYNTVLASSIFALASADIVVMVATNPVPPPISPT